MTAVPAAILDIGSILIAPRVCVQSGRDRDDYEAC